MLWLLIIAIFATVLFRAYRNTFVPTINYIDINLNPKDDNTKNMPPLKILHLSDLHMENLSVKANWIVDSFHEETFDLIAITGDLLDRAKNIPTAVQYVEAVHTKFRPALGTYVVFGNHDYVLPPMKLAQLKVELERIGCHVLLNRSVTVQLPETKLHIIGIDDYHSRKSDLQKSFANVDEEGIRLVLTHDPNIILTMQEYPYDYLLSGHFHGGQIHWPKAYHLRSMGKLPRMNIVKGLHYHEGRPFYISEGLGQTGLNIRLRSRPEITVHTLQTQSIPTAHQVAPVENVLNESVPTLALE